MNWHKDCHHNKLIKIMYFVSDVFDENGPTTAIDLKTSAKVKYVNFQDYFDDFIEITDLTQAFEAL